jgi:general secretion pathway protein J
MQGFAKKPEEAGFTLVEMLVALTIFALLAAAGVGLLRSSVDTQTVVGQRLSDVSTIARLQAILTSDLAHVVAANQVVAANGVQAASTPMFNGSGTGMEFVRSGIMQMDAAAASSVERVTWRAEGSAISRGSEPYATASSNRVAARLIGGLTQTRFRYRLSSGGWADSFQGSKEEPAPQAVEITLVQTGRPQLTIVAALPAAGIDGAPAQPTPAPGAPA